MPTTDRREGRRRHRVQRLEPGTNASMTSAVEADSGRGAAQQGTAEGSGDGTGSERYSGHCQVAASDGAVHFAVRCSLAGTLLGVSL